MVYIGNAFSIQMLPMEEEEEILLKVTKVTTEQVTEALKKEFPSVVSAIGHLDTANIVGSILGMEIPMNRVSIRVNKGDVLYVAQIMGGRLPEGATTLPEGVEMRFFKVELV